MKNLKEKMNKKVIAVMVTGAVVFGSIGGGAYAYKDEWTSKINRGVDALAGYIYKDDVQNAINTHNEGLKNDLRKFISDTIASASAKLNEHKQNEINRGKEALDNKLSEDKRRATEAVNNAVANEKAEQEAKTNAQVETDKAELDAIVDAELNKVPN